jgi:tRNA (mo5U34)-methyltransferase
LDISCHEGYFSIVLSDYFKYVTGIDRNPESLVKAMQIALAMGRTTIQFYESSVEDWVEKRAADFVLCFGLLYHVENPIQILRKLSLLTKKTLCIETQVCRSILPEVLRMGAISGKEILWVYLVFVLIIHIEPREDSLT